ncbi:hypothetical protein BDQ17DRAFT_1271720 [Cyathus striatus]|nr:hypothetical protein BDQ17DRAFT_1271720 [Cyathus striatus]
MSKSSTSSAPKISTQLPAKSAWSKGPPQTSSRPQSPAPPSTPHQTHSRRPSALGQGVPVKDGVSVPRNNVGAVKQQGSAVTFGSIDDVSAPVSSSPASAPPVRSEGVKSFGSVPNAGHVNGKPSVSSRPTAVPAASSSSSSPSATPAASTSAPSKIAKVDVRKLFQNPSSGPSSQAASDTSSPSMRPANLPSQPSTSTSQQGPPSQSSQMGHSYTPFVPRPPQQQSAGPAGGPPRSPVYPRQVPNGSVPRSQSGPNGGPSGMPSPRLGPHPHNAQPSGMPPQPQMQPGMQPGIPQQMPVTWSYYYAPEQAYYGWYMPQMSGQPPQHPTQHPPPGPHAPPHTGMPMSPRNPPPPLQPGTPTISHAAPVPHVPPPLSHSTSISSPPPTPSSSAMPTSARLNPGSNAFVPGGAAPRKVTLKSPDGTEINLAKHSPSPSITSLPPQASPYRQGSPGMPNRRPNSVRMETEEQRKKRLELENANKEKEEKQKAKAREDEEKHKREEEEAKAKKAKEEEDKKKRKAEEEEREKERKRKEEEEKERLKREDEERLRKQKAEEEKKKKAEEEAEKKRKEEEERRVKEEEERNVKEAEERKRKEEEEEKERQRVAEEEIAKAKAVSEAVLLETASEPKSKEEAKEEGELDDESSEGVAVPAATTQEAKEEPREKEKAKEPLRINTGRHRPGPLDLSMTKGINAPAPPSALATARIIEDISSISYPEGVQSPRAELNTNTKGGKFRYDRDFLLQFMNICKEKPDMLPPLDVLGLEPVDPAQHAMSRTSSGRGPKGSGPQRQPSLGLGFGPSTGFGKPGSTNPFSMGNFGTMGAKLSSDERFALATGRSASVSAAAGLPFNRPQTMIRTPSQGGPGGPQIPSNRTRSKRGEKRGDGGNKAGGHQGHGMSYAQQQAAQAANLEPVVPLQPSANRWDRKSLQVDTDSPEMVDRKVKGLLNKLTMEKFDAISDQIIAWANKSEREKDGRTLIQVIRLVFEKATDEATWSEMYARLCRKMMEQISSKVQDEGIKNNEGKPIAGGQLFRKYLLNRCQEDFERGWVNKEATAAAAATKALEDEAAKAANEKNQAGGQEEVALYSDEYYAAQKAKRQGLGLIKFIGELFKLQMLTERIMHECVKKLLGNVENPEEEEIESLCKLLTTVGSILDTPKAKAHMDVYFSRMKELTKSQNVSSRMQFMLQDVIELRERKWISRNAVAAPSTISQIHEAAARAEKDKESLRQISMSRGGSRRGATREEFPQVGPDGWAVAGGSAPRPPPKAGDLSQFGKISKAQPPTFGKPNSVFAGKKGGEKEAVSRSSSNSNMFMMLSQGTDAGDSKAPEAVPPQRKKLVLQPRSKPVEEARPAAESDGSDDEAPTVAPEMTDKDADKKITEDLKEFFGVRSLDEAEVYFTTLPEQFHHKLVYNLVSTAVESKEADAQLVAALFDRAVSKKLCSSSAFEEGLTPIADIIDDIAIDAPKAFQLFATMVKGALLDEDQRNRLASKSVDTEKLLSLLS